MFKKFLILIALSLYVSIANCAAISEQSTSVEEIDKVIELNKNADKAFLVSSSINKFFFDLHKSKISNQEKIIQVKDLIKTIKSKLDSQTLKLRIFALLAKIECFFEDNDVEFCAEGLMQF